jgi:hypothetical protein
LSSTGAALQSGQKRGQKEDGDATKLSSTPSPIWSTAACESRGGAIHPEIRQRRIEGPPLS